MIFSAPRTKGVLYDYYRSLVEALAAHAPVEGVALLPVDPDSFAPQVLGDSASYNVGVYLPEDGLVTPHCLFASFRWDLIVVPSQWLEFQLRIRGFGNVVTIAPGHDSPPADMLPTKQHTAGFVVAVGGSIGLHNGHDLAFAALGQFMSRRPDVTVVCCGMLSECEIRSLGGMSRCSVPEADAVCDSPAFFRLNGLDPARVTHMSADSSWDNAATADLYLDVRRADLGGDRLSRGFEALGKPVLTFEPLECAPVLAGDGTTVWYEPTVAQIIEQLEAAYERCRQRSAMLQGADGLRSWAAAARQLQDVLMPCFPTPGMPTVYVWNKRGAALSDLGLFDLAENNHRHALFQSPFNPETYNCLGNVLDRQGRHQEALLYFEKAINLDRDFVAAIFNRATTLKELQRFEESIAAYRQALQVDPKFAKGWLNLAVAYSMNRQEDAATECFKKTLELDPADTDALFLWGNQLLGQMEFEKAIELYERAVALEPDHYLAYNSMGIAYLSLMEADKAYAVLRRALSIKPDMTSAMTNLGTACRDREQFPESLYWYEQAIALEPENADNHWNYSLALLHIGNYEKGWREYEWRFQKSDKLAIRPCELPRWDGGSLDGKTLVVQVEQGYGDTIQFMRYVPLVVARGGTIIVECQDGGIKPLVERIPGVAQVITAHDEMPQADARVPMLSLPLAFNTTVHTIPFAEGYLNLPDNMLEYWRTRLSTNEVLRGKSLKVGFVWDGRKTFRNDKRSVPLMELEPLFAIEDVAFVSLQKGEVARQLGPLARRHAIVDVTDSLETFLDTAAVIATLDLVICVDTSVAHLAGAVGCPTWVMLKKGPDWRWLDKRQDSPWYASVRLFRQTRDGVWSDVISSIGENLTELKKTLKLSSGVPINELTNT